jgi:hypothetical protein
MRRYARSLAALVALALSGCAWDWDRYQPRADGSTRPDSATDGALADAPNDALAPPNDAAPCGSLGLQCCANGSCETGLLCASGTCMACPMGQTACAGACVDTASNMVHCGACDNRCRGNQRCVMSVCQ